MAIRSEYARNWKRGIPGKDTFDFRCTITIEHEQKFVAWLVEDEIVYISSCLFEWLRTYREEEPRPRP